MRVLGVDQGSVSLGLAAAQDGAGGMAKWRTWRIGASGDDPHERLRYIGHEIENLAGVLGQDDLEPDLIGIESVAVGFNVLTALKMAETRGFLLATFQRLYPRARIVDVNLAQTKITAGLKGNTPRAIAKPATVAFVRDLLGRELGEDESDAVAIALSAVRLAENPPVRKPRAKRRKVKTAAA